MQRIPQLLVVTLTLVAVALLGPRAAAAESSPEATIKAFYKWYVNVMVKDENPFGKTQREEMERYLTADYVKRIDKQIKGDGFDSDPFLNAQDFDKEWGSNVKVTNTTTKGDRATADVELTGSEMGSTKTKVELKQDGGSWKIDKVDARE
jgi:hypothetical protein